MNMTPIVQATDLVRQVDSGDGEPLIILDGVGFSVNAGEAVAVVGASGSGKSTLLGLLAGLDLPDGGEVLLHGQPFSSQSEDTRARLRGRHMGFVFQSFQLLGDLSALENAMLPLELLGRERPRERALAALEAVGLGHRLHHRPGQMSGGEQQRCAIARAIAGEPDLLLADEPTGNLDAGTGAQIIELLFGLNERAGTTLLLVTHDPALARRCQRSLHITAGRLVEDEA